MSRLVAAAFWLLVWQLGSMAVGSALILPGPFEVLLSLTSLVANAGFWGKVIFSFVRIVGATALAYVVALCLAAASHASTVVRALVRPPMLACKATPVVCVVVLLLLWLGSANVSVAAVFLMVLPAVYFSALEGADQESASLADLMDVHGVRGLRRVLAYWWPQVLPFLCASSETVVGMSWKAGVAAELIGMPAGSIGERIYQAKLLLETSDLFAWTIVIIILAALCERAFLWLLRRSSRTSLLLALRLGGRGVGGACAATSVDVLECGQNSGDPFAQTVTDAADGVSGGGGDGITLEAGGKLRSTPPAAACKLNNDEMVVASTCVPGSCVSFKGVVLPHGAAAGKPVSFELFAGERLCLMAPSGVGKTTLLHVFAGLETPVAGEVRIPSRVSMMFQDCRLIEDASALENVMLFADGALSADELRTLLTSVLPDVDPNNPVSELSGGQRRRVELVRALAAPGEAVLLDEPFSGLDDDARERACALVERELCGRALVIATHDEGDAGRLHASVFRL